MEALSSEPWTLPPRWSSESGSAHHAVLSLDLPLLTSFPQPALLTVLLPPAPLLEGCSMDPFSCRGSQQCSAPCPMRAPWLPSAVPPLLPGGGKLLQRTQAGKFTELLPKIRELHSLCMLRCLQIWCSQSEIVTLWAVEENRNSGCNSGGVSVTHEDPSPSWA